MAGMKKEEIEVILNSTHDAIIAVNDRGIITLFNSAAECLTGPGYPVSLKPMF